MTQWAGEGNFSRSTKKEIEVTTLKIQLKKPKPKVDKPKAKDYTVIGNLACRSGKEVVTDMASPQKTVRGTLVDDRGTWTVRGRVYDPATGKTRQRAKSTGFKVKDHTKRRAEEAMRDILAQWRIEANTTPMVHDPLFGDYVEKWLKKKSFDLRENSLKSYRDYADKHIIPGLGYLKVRKMTIQDLQVYYEEKLKTLSVRSLKKQHCVVSGALYEAELDQLIPANFAKDFKFPKATKFEGKAYTEDQVALLLTAAEQEGEPIRAAITLAVCYGLRREEVCGLRWQDVDFDDGKLYIRNTVTQNGTLRIEAERTKTQKSRRTIPLIASTVPYLNQLKQTQEQQGLNLDKIVVWPDGRSVRPDYISSKTSRVIKAYGLEHIRLHDLRHTAVSLLAATKQVTPKQMQEFLGHEDITTTLNIYTHVQDEDRKATSGVMDAILKDSVFCSEKCSGFESGKT